MISVASFRVACPVQDVRWYLINPFAVRARCLIDPSKLVPKDNMRSREGGVRAGLAMARMEGTCKTLPVKMR
jgi:hypothetical protein